MTVKVALCGWELTDAQFSLLEKISKKLHAMSELVEEATCTDVKALKPPEADIFIAFGDIAYNSISSQNETWRAPSVSLMQTSDARRYKIRVNEILVEIIESIKRGNNVAQTETHIETNQGTTVGLNANIKITTEEAEYLKTIKEIVGGGTVVIKNGDTEIRIEDKNGEYTRENSKE